ncbi:MAG: aminoacyl-tRNA hydrolase [Gammaproteobacteria bacterium]|nr:aminoacyl-tRNA hydrolase [Gammaproteobacteria bacterium]
MALVEIASGVEVPEEALAWKFVRASGPGGQHVNKVSTAVELRFDVDRSGLPDGWARRLRAAAGQRLAASGEIVIFAQTHRSQSRNRETALARLGELVAETRTPPTPRRPTTPTPGARARRREHKRRRGEVKRDRAPPDPDM